MNASTIFFKIRRLAGVAVLAVSSPGVLASEICAGSCPVLNLPPVSIEQPPPTHPVTITPVSLLELIPQQTVVGWSYGFAISSLGESINVITLPYFADSQITSIATPSGWSFETGATDLFGLGNGAGYMQWSYNGTPPANVYPWYSFDSAWAPALTTLTVTATDQTTYNLSVDIPLSPQAVAAGLKLDPMAVPLPAGYTLFLTGIGVIGAARARLSAKC